MGSKPYPSTSSSRSVDYFFYSIQSLLGVQFTLSVSLEPSGGKALLLTTSTEVSIAPKTRTQTKAPVSRAASASATNQLTAKTKSAIGPSVGTAEETVRTHAKITRTFKVIPGRVLPPFTPPTPAADDSSIAAIAIVSKTTLRLIHFNDPSKPSADWKEAKSWRASVRRLLPPQDPSTPQEQKGSVGQNALVPHVFNPGDPAATKSSSTVVASGPSNEILVTWSPDIPVPGGLAVFHGSVDGIEDWDMVKSVDIARGYTFGLTCSDCIRVDFIEEYNKPINSERKESSRPYQ